MITQNTMDPKLATPTILDSSISFYIIKGTKLSAEEIYLSTSLQSTMDSSTPGLFTVWRTSYNC